MLRDVKEISNFETEEDVQSTGSGDEEDNGSGASERSTQYSDTQTSKDDAADLYFATAESRHVRSLKRLVLIVLALVTVAVCLAVYFVTTKGQESEFEGAFEGSADKVISSFQEILEQKIAAIASLGVTFTAYAKKDNATWPFVTMNDFQQRSASARSLSKALFMELLPIVTDEDRLEWEEYSLENKDWLSEGRAYQARNNLGTRRSLELNDGDSVTGDVVLSFTEGESSISNKIFTFDEKWDVVSDPGPGPYYPIWQSSPVLPEPRDLVNYNLIDYVDYGPFIDLAAKTGQMAIGGLDIAEEGDITHPELTTSFFAYILSFTAGKWTNYTGDPMSSVYVPVVDSFEFDRKTVGILVAVINWATYFENTLPINAKPVSVVLENTCDGPFTYEVSGEGVKYLGKGNLADPKYEDMKAVVELDSSLFVAEANTIALTLNQDLCQYSLSVYPTIEMDEHYNDAFPLAITLVVAAVFVFTTASFLVYDHMVEKRQNLVLSTAQKSTAIVSSIFPKNVRDQLMEAPVQGNATKLRSIMHKGRSDMERNTKEVSHDIAESSPIADLFPEATVMFADVAGFTAWSSVREPSQVFTLLETLYHAFDQVATRRRVFKVETVGDCYVAVAGLPDPCKDHAVIMAKFAMDCINQMIILTKKLEVTLGPDTGDLQLRIGLHSGPVTAGVLRGERSRFQLFGDTVNTASRMESSGNGNKIHISEQTAEYLKSSGKGEWVQEREDLVQLKGKGELKTYWLATAKPGRHDSSIIDPSSTNVAQVYISSKSEINSAQRLIAWNVDILQRLIKQIVAHRQYVEKKKKDSQHSSKSQKNGSPEWIPNGTNPLDEVVEIIHLPDLKQGGITHDVRNLELDPDVVFQIQDYVVGLSKLYRNNSFHNFEHASHVTMSVAKLLSRIVAPSDMDFSDGAQANASLHDHTYGITSDPLTQFACVLSALIHDVDHQGVPNPQLVQEEDPLVELYKGKSVAEQNSVDLAWDLFMEKQYETLRATICKDSTELARLRQLIVNTVLATDIMDKDLKNLRNDRWDKAFSESYAKSNQDTPRDVINRKATIVIEHLIQASDVSHTMQHWSVYRKWNSRLFREMYRAYKEGRAAKDPSEFWYKGEIGFFDFYIIPLAKKLKECGVFGVSSDEYLQYAMNNRNEWERKGESVVAELIDSVQEEYSA